MRAGRLAETDETARTFVERKWPQIAVVENAKIFTEEWIQENVDASDPGVSGVLLIGGEPCQPFSSLGKQKGFREHSERAHLVHVFPEAKDALADVCRNCKPFRWLLEETGTRPDKDRRPFSEILGQIPVAIQSADWGWVHRL